MYIPHNIFFIVKIYNSVIYHILTITAKENNFEHSKCMLSFLVLQYVNVKGEATVKPTLRPILFDLSHLR